MFGRNCWSTYTMLQWQRMQTEIAALVPKVVELGKIYSVTGNRFSSVLAGIKTGIGITRYLQRRAGSRRFLPVSPNKNNKSKAFLIRWSCSNKLLGCSKTFRIHISSYRGRCDMRPLRFADSLHRLQLCYSRVACLDANAADWQVINPRCEYAVDPLGIDVAQPRLYWQLDEYAARAATIRLTKYSWPVRKSCSTKTKAICGTRASGISNQSTHVPYDGKELKSSQEVFWKARAWDEQDQPSAVEFPRELDDGNRPAIDDWQAKWIVAPWQTESVLTAA